MSQRAAAPAKRRPARAPRVKQTPKTAADLDAEMEVRAFVFCPS